MGVADTGVVSSVCSLSSEGDLHCPSAVGVPCLRHSSKVGGAVKGGVVLSHLWGGWALLDHVILQDVL